jgi:hypothetical protein
MKKIMLTTLMASLFAIAFFFSYSSRGSFVPKQAGASGQTWKATLVKCTYGPDGTYGVYCFNGPDTACIPLNCPESN